MLSFSLSLVLLLVWIAFVRADLFDSLDLNHDGALDRNEFSQGVGAFYDFVKDHKSTTWFDALQLTSFKGFWKALTSGIAVILATEIGDKTFFIAAVLSMKHDRLAVFSGAILALIIMTILSTAMGMVLPQLIDKQYTHILGGILFLYFGCKLVYESRTMEAGQHSEELEEVEEELLQQTSKKEDTQVDVEGQLRYNKNSKSPGKSHYQVFLQSLTLTFLAEWGDRSQIATIALGTAKNPLGVMVGGCLGHSLCTGLAVLGGRILASRISEKMVSQWGGIVFLVFGVHSIFFEE